MLSWHSLYTPSGKSADTNHARNQKDQKSKAVGSVSDWSQVTDSKTSAAWGRNVTAHGNTGILPLGAHTADGNQEMPSNKHPNCYQENKNRTSRRQRS